jgi:hypothetical protein
VADIHVFALGDADWTGVSAITIDVRNGAGDAGSCVVTPAAAEHHLALPLAPPFEMRTRVLADVDPEALGAAPGEASPFAPMDGWTVPVDPALLAGRRVIALGLGHAGAGLRVQGRLATGVDHREFVLDAGRPEVRVPVWQSAPVRIEWATELDGSTGPSAARTLSAGETSVVFNEPADRFRTVTVMLQDPLARLASVSVEIESQPGGSRRAVRVDAATPRATLSIEKPGADGAARFRATVVALDGATAEDSWRDLAGSLLIVGDRGLRVERIHGVLAGVPESLGALVRLTSLSPPPGVSPASEVVLDPGVSEFDLALAFADDAPRRYRVEGQLFLADGERTIGPLEEDAEVLILDVSAA